MLKKVKIRITTDRLAAKGSLFTPERDGALLPPDEAAWRTGEVQRTETVTEGSYHDDGHRVCIRYKESELSGMEGSSTTIAFQKVEPSDLQMLRDGSVKTALSFAPHARRECVYQTPIMPFDVCLYTRAVTNELETQGYLLLDYTVEIKGAQAEHTRLALQLLPCFDKPQSK